MVQLHHQKYLMLSIWLGLVLTITTLGWQFPVQEVSLPECRGDPFEQLDASCKTTIQEAVKDEHLGTLLFSALWGASYIDPQEQGAGGHPSLDIPTAAGTPVYAIADGMVTRASNLGEYGLSVTIRHTLGDTLYYSNYSHLASYDVQAGQHIKEGTVLGKVGCTGFTVSGDPSRCGNHLDFQITTEQSPSHPYGYHDCAGGYLNAVNEGTCRDKLAAYTIDPLEFLEQYGALSSLPIVKKADSRSSGGSSKPTLANIFARLRAQNKAILQQHTITDTAQHTASTASATNNAIPSANILSTTTMVTEKLANEITVTHNSASPTPHSLMIDDLQLSRKRNTDITRLSTGKFITLTLTINDKFGNPFSGTLPHPIRLTTNTTQGTIAPTQFDSIHKGIKYLTYHTIQPGSSILHMRRGDHIILEEVLIIEDASDF